MGLFLLISAYFVPGSYDRKGPARFVKDRLIRLGIPLAIYCWVLRPIFLYAKISMSGEMNSSFLSWFEYGYFRDYGLIGGGPSWFIEAVLLFSLLYALWRWLIPSHPQVTTQETKFPSHLAIALFALSLAVVSFIVRLWFPCDSSFRPLNFQLADFPQYIALFILGLVAYQRNWFENLPEKTAKTWLIIGLVLILAYPPIAILGGAIENVEPFKGGWNWQSLLNATWQAFVCVSMCIGLIYIFRRFFNRQGALSSFFSRNAYTVYLIHEPAITFLALALAGLMLYPFLKFGLVDLLAIPLCFGLSSLIRKLPYTQRVL
jgi:surface polysaccharide O-acyltransferase-like enzyme